jgi:hypothetical protein
VVCDDLTVTPSTGGPDFVIAGAMRSGTTSLHHWLRSHPAVHMSTPKEVHYFDLHYERGPQWYAGHFAGAAPGQVTGESTPEYLFLPWARERLADDVPRAKLVVTLRDPVERAWSHYCMLRERGRETLPFAEALDREPDRLRDPAAWSRYGYVAKGRYAEQLTHLISLQGRDRVLVLLFERDVVGAPERTFGRLCAFLGVQEVRVPSVGSAVNAAIHVRSPLLRRAARPLPRSLRNAVGRLNGRPRTNAPLRDDLRARLRDEFAGANRALEGLLGTEIPEWQGATLRQAPRAGH